MELKMFRREGSIRTVSEPKYENNFVFNKFKTQQDSKEFSFNSSIETKILTEEPFKLNISRR